MILMALDISSNEALAHNHHFDPLNCILAIHRPLTLISPILGHWNVVVVKVQTARGTQMLRREKVTSTSMYRTTQMLLLALQFLTVPLPSPPITWHWTGREPHAACSLDVHCSNELQALGERLDNGHGTDTRHYCESVIHGDGEADACPAVIPLHGDSFEYRAGLAPDVRRRLVHPPCYCPHNPRAAGCEPDRCRA